MLKARLCGGIAILLLTACGSDQTADEPLRLPDREKTWVKTEQVDITKDAALAPKDGAAINIPINKDLPPAWPCSILWIKHVCSFSGRVVPGVCLSDRP